MGFPRWIICAVIGALPLGAGLAAAELPSQARRVKHAKSVKHCNIAGSPGILAANGVCVRISGYVSAGFGAGQTR